MYRIKKDQTLGKRAVCRLISCVIKIEIFYRKISRKSFFSERILAKICKKTSIDKEYTKIIKFITNER